MANQLTEEMFDWLNANCRADIVDAIQSQTDRIAELENAKQFIQNFAEEQHRRACALEEFQTKPLTDEEIMDIAEQSDYSPVEIEMGYDYEIRIARAIEERHGIK